jgi:hypothetical protein
MTAQPGDAVGPGGIRFYDEFVPAIEVGDYLLDVTEHLDPPGAGIDETFEATQLLSVAGPRWSLPPADVFSTYPPNEALGQFEQDLPHVVLTARELPWERNVFEEPESGPQTPWLALLVLDPEELLVADEAEVNRTRSTSIPAGQLFAPHTDPKTRWPRLAPEWYEADAVAAGACTVIDVSPATFGALIPSRESLRYFSHARQVDATAKDAGVLGVSGDGWYSVVVANRLPPASETDARRCIAHLVSLEGLTDCVDDPAKLTGCERVRMISLWGWTFTCSPDGSETFAELARGLAGNGTAMSIPARLGSDPEPAEAEAAGMLRRGYSPLPWRTRLGEQTWGWYRGPFSPEPVAAFVDRGQPAPEETGWQPFGTASAAIVYDPGSGSFDLSYAVAWETGRLLALADGAFSRALLDWQRRGHRLVDLIAERMAQAPALSWLKLAGSPTEGEVLALVRKYALTDELMGSLVSELAEQLRPRVSAPGAPAPEPPAPPYPAPPSPSLDPQTIAELMTEAGIQEAIRTVGGRQLDAIADWLGRRYALEGVPFEALVPNAALLPAESIRCFYVDVNWLDALLQGALSVGVESSRDTVYQDLMKDLLWDSAIAAAALLRGQLLGRELPAVGGEPEGMAGMLLRSALVSGWPGLEARGYEKTASDGSPDLDTEIPLLRMERLGGGVMLCLWPQVPAVVAIGEPQEGVGFGFEDAPPGQSGRFWLDLRSVEASGYGERLEKWIDAEAAIGPDRVLDLGRLRGELEGKLGPLAVRDFATELIRVPERALFGADPGPGGGR